MWTLHYTRILGQQVWTNDWDRGRWQKQGQKWAPLSAIVVLLYSWSIILHLLVHHLPLLKNTPKPCLKCSTYQEGVPQKVVRHWQGVGAWWAGGRLHTTKPSRFSFLIKSRHCPRGKYWLLRNEDTTVELNTGCYWIDRNSWSVYEHWSPNLYM